jgi:hypothetical protein
VTVFRKFLFFLPVAAAAATVPAGRAQEPLVVPAPLSARPAEAPVGRAALVLAAAQRAQDLGLPTLAADLYRELRDAPGADRVALDLVRATALLDAGEAAEAEKALQGIPEPRGAAWRLRAGLAALQLGRRPEAQAQWDAIQESEVEPADLPWYRFFTGALWDTATPRDVSKANTFYVQAEALAATPLARARFQLAGEMVRLKFLGAPTPENLEQTRRNFEQWRASAIGYGLAEEYATKLSMVQRAGDAVEFLQREVLLGLPRQEAAWRDRFNFLIGLIGDRSRNGPGRAALSQLLESGVMRERQRQALQLLAAASPAEPERQPERQHFRDLLRKLIDAKPDHPIKESLLLHRAQLALGEKNFTQTEEDANALLRQFPQSVLRVHALTLLAQSAWEQRRYRLVATHAQTARTELEAIAKAAPDAATAAAPGAGPVYPARLRLDLGVLEAEAWFRAGDFRNAADAYAVVLRDRPAAMEAERVDDLMFQRVMAEIKADAAAAGRVLDELARDPAFGVGNRWESEWHLARALNLRGTEGIRQAYTRVTELLRGTSGEAAGLDPELRAKMGWLQARLAFDNGNAAEALGFVDAQLAAPVEVAAALRDEITSILTLLKARAEFALAREPAALATLKGLREKFPGTEAATSSFLIESEYYAAQDKIDEARNRLILLTDNPAYSGSPYVPFALYRLALLSERLGRKENLEEANQRIEDLMKRPTGVDAAVLFAARLRQGDIFRKLNDFPSAQRAYEYLINNYPRRPDVVLAYLALADCHTAQATPPPGMPGDPSHADAAQRIYEQLRDRVDAPRDVQVEAGYKLGALLVRRGRLEDAAKAWWIDFVKPFLRDETRPIEPDAKRPYWLARTLCELGELQEKRGRIDEARAAYRLVLEKRLPYGETIARTRLEQLGGAGSRPGQ